MARTYEELNIALDNCIETGIIYNVDFQDWKSFGATRSLEKDIRAAKDNHYYPRAREARLADTVETLSWELVNISIMTFPSKKLMKALDVADKDDEFVVAIKNIVDRWTIIADKFKTLKPMIVKGRKPSTDPRKTPERTLENTGTCACCGKNVKMDANGKLVNHGFTIRYGFQEGQCPGVDCDPIEVSVEGLLKFGEMLNRMLTSANSAVLTLNAKLHTTTDAEATRKLNGQIYQAERQAKWVGDDLARVQLRVKEWKPSTLPGDALAA